MSIYVLLRYQYIVLTVGLRRGKAETEGGDGDDGVGSHDDYFRL